MQHNKLYLACTQTKRAESDSALFVQIIPFNYCLEANAIILDTGIRNGDKPDLLVAGADIGHVDTEHFQAIFQLLQGEVILGQHDRSPFVGNPDK